MTESQETSRKLSRQQLRALAREKRDAEGWIARFGVTDPHMRRCIREALGSRRVTRAELEEAIGVSLETPTPEQTG